MDTFFEQIVAIRKTAKDWILFIGLWILAVVLIGLVLMFTMGSMLMPFGFLIVIGIGYGAYKLSGKFSVEYEYIVTNGSFDVDKIIARSSRKRELSFEVSGVERLEKFNPSAPPVGNFKKTVMACNADDPNAYFMVINEEGKGSRLLVFSPNDRVKGALVKFLPKFIANSAFK